MRATLILVQWRLLVDFFEVAVPCFRESLHQVDELVGRKHELWLEFFPAWFFGAFTVGDMIGIDRNRFIVTAAFGAPQGKVVDPRRTICLDTSECCFEHLSFGWQALLEFVRSAVEHIHPLVEEGLLSGDDSRAAQFQTHSIRNGRRHRVAREVARSGVELDLGRTLVADHDSILPFGVCVYRSSLKQFQSIPLPRASPMTAWRD